MKNFKTLAEFIGYFKDEETCRKYFESIRFADGDYCPHCKHDKIFRFKDGKRFRCDKCKRDFTVKTGTLFGESKLPLQKWFIAIYLLTTRKKGISSIELAEQVGVSQKTAWFVDHRIREALKQDTGKLFGVVEVDETLVGGRSTMKQKMRNKSSVVGMTERKGRARIKQTENRQTPTIRKTILENVEKGSHLMTDEWYSYRLAHKWGYKNSRIKHQKRNYVRGNVHTNSIESFWALFKRQYHGTHHSVSKKHLQRYIDEVTYRFNNREMSMDELFGEVTKRIAKHGKMSYKKLTA